MKDRKIKRVFICLLAVLVFAVSSVSVFAKEFTEADGEELISSCKRYLESLYTYDEDELEQMKDLGDFYMVTSEMITSTREEVGAFVGNLEGGTCEIGSTDIMITLPVQYEKYSAQVMFTFDSTGTEPKNFVINPDYSLGEKMAGAFQNFILGIIIVFIMLLFLAFIISLLKFVNPDVRRKRALEKAKQAEPAVKEQAKAPEAASAPAAAAVPVQHAPAPVVSDDPEIIAVMAAAIAAAKAEVPGGNYVVRSIRRAGTARKWTRS